MREGILNILGEEIDYTKIENIQRQLRKMKINKDEIATNIFNLYMKYIKLGCKENRFDNYKIRYDYGQLRFYVCKPRKRIIYIHGNVNSGDVYEIEMETENILYIKEIVKILKERIEIRIDVLNEEMNQKKEYYKAIEEMF